MKYIIGTLVFALIDFIIMLVAKFLKKRAFKANMKKIADDFEALGYVAHASDIRRKYKIRK